MGVLQYNRKRFFDGVGTEINSEQQDSLENVIKAAGLDYVVEKVKSYDEDGDEIGSYHTRYFDKDGNKHILGTGLKDQYTVLQNFEAFDFVQDVLQDVKIECAGNTEGGKKAFICASTEPIKVLDEDIDPYLVFFASHDGSSGIKLMLTPIRVFCSNCMSRASKQAQSVFSIRHSRNVHDRLYIAKDILLKNTEYLNQYKNAIEDMAHVRFTRRQFVDKLAPFVLHQMGLVDADGQPIEKKRNANIVDVYRDQLLAEWSAEDTRNQSNTLVNMWNAITAFESHIVPRRNAENPETKFRQVVAGMTLSNLAVEYAANLVGHQLKF